MARKIQRYGDPDVLELVLDARNLLGGIDELTRRQMPFALSLATNRTAFDARDKLREELPLHFTIRNKWVARRTAVQKGTKRDPTAIVGHLEEFMALQTFGGYRTPEPGQPLSVPVRIRRPLTVKTTPGKWPGRLIERRRTVIMDLAGGTSGLFTIKGRAGAESLTFMYLFTDRARIEAAWPFQRTVEGAVRDSWPKRAPEALKQALESAKKKAPKRRRR